MKVLMLGWEYPPHITGGLATACAGLCAGLHHHEVEVTFVVPRATGDEDSTNARVIGCNDLEVDEETVEHVEVERVRHVQGETREVETQRLRSRPSFVLPPTDLPAPSAYATPSALREWLESLRERAKPVRVGTHVELENSTHSVREPDRTERSIERVPVRRSERRKYEFTGKYGPDLFAEVERYARCVEALARRESFDLVHAHDWMTFPAGVAAARTLGRPLVAHVHACEYDRSGEKPDTRIRDLEQLGLDSAERVVCVSHYTGSVLRKNYRVDEAKLRVVHNAVTKGEQERSTGGSKRIEEPVVLFLGRVTYQKGPDYFLEAAARVVKVEPNVKFVMVGSGDMLPKMVERAARMGLARHVHFTGFLKGADVERIYSMADIYVMPSVSEPFGISPLEALALDVPVIVSRQSGVSEVLRNALKVDFWDVQEIANKILALLKFPSLKEHLLAEGRDEVRAMSWDERAAALKLVYDEVAGAPDVAPERAR